MPSKTSSSLLIKGYLPVRLSLPSTEDETFFFVKEHFSSDKSTLFVANVPFVPGVSSRILLQSLFGRFGTIERVTVIDNPRKAASTITSTIDTKAWSNSKNPSFLGPSYSQGRFAHVVFSSSKEMKKSLKELVNIMSKKSSEGILPGLSLERLEIQTLQDETIRQDKSNTGMEDSDEEEDEIIGKQQPKKGILAVAERYRASCSVLTRESLLEECNTVMEQYEDAEETERRAREASKSEPDEDGFITVSYSSQSIGSKRELEQGGGRRKGSKRSRKKKDANEGLTDFYRFQTKESRKQNLQDLRKRFEQDLAKVKKMKEERQYRPF